LRKQSSIKPDFIAKKVRVEHFLDEVRIVLTCDGDYEALVLYEDLIERAERGQLTIGFSGTRTRPCPSS
jgi:hypothetical protein